MTTTIAQRIIVINIALQSGSSYQELPNHTSTVRSISSRGQSLVSAAGKKVTLWRFDESAGKLCEQGRSPLSTTDSSIGSWARRNSVDFGRYAGVGEVREVVHLDDGNVVVVLGGGKVL